MNKLLAALLMAVALNANASTGQASHGHGGSVARGPHGGIAVGMALQASRASQSTASQSSGNGGSTRSVVDDFQPWPESEMRQFQKAQWQPYKGE